MSISVLVRTYTGNILDSSTDSRIGVIFALAKSAGLPFLGNIDPYDDTVFNRLQARIVRAELEVLLGSSGAEELPMLEGIIGLVDLVMQRPHRYLVFNGD